MAGAGELAPNTVHSGVFRVKYGIKGGLFMKFVDATIEIISNSDQNVLSVTIDSKKNTEDPITFPLDPFSSEVYLLPCNFKCKNSRNLTQFRIVNLIKRMDYFQCESIVQLHRLYASSGKGPESGLFSSPNQTVDPMGSTVGMAISWVRVSHEFPYDHQEMLDKICKAKINSNPMVRPRSHPSTPPPTYIEAIKRFPMAYYRPEYVHTFPVCTVPTAPPLERSVCSQHISRDQHDTFLPPYGVPLSYPISLGFGAEIDLEEDIQEMFDPKDDSIFYLNHKNYKFLADDPRLLPIPEEPLSRQTIRLNSATTGTILIPNLSYDDVTASQCQIEKMASLAEKRWKDHPGYRINVSGEDGWNGENGVKGQGGFFGCRGADGRFYGGPGDKGQGGKDGISGSNGSRGKNGTNGGDVYINLSGDSSRLVLSGDVREEFDMGGDTSSAILYIDVSGGNGGKGGRGGNGGPGGRGGVGGHGHKGIVGIDAMIPGGAGGAGQSGGRGGRGGTGGDGGNGGFGGDGGGGGNGGRLIISCYNPALFSLVEVDCSGGNGGKGGRGGDGGERGKGGTGGGGGDSGRGGMGGPGTDDSTAGFHGAVGRVGVVGESGKPGSGGYKGTQGRQGVSGTPGNVTWVVLREDNSIRHLGNMKFNVEIIEDNICLYSAVDDDIFEPSERISVAGIQIRNSGDIPLSAGAKLRMMSSDTINFEKTFVLLPELAPGMMHNVNEVLFGRIFDIPPPSTKEVFKSLATFTIQVDLNNRVVTESTPQKSFKVQYPVALKNIVYNNMVGGQSRGKAAHMKIMIENVSNKHYGTSHDSGGYVSLEIRLDKRLVPVGYSNNPGNKEYDVYYDHNASDSFVVVMKELKPNSCVSVELKLFLVRNSEIYDRCLWQVNLLLRQKLIQYRYGYVEVIPGKLGHTDISENSALLVVHQKHLNRSELLFWESILSGLGLDVEFWDLNCYQSLQAQTEDENEDDISRVAEWSKMFRGKLVIFPHANLCLTSVDEIVSFFHGDDWKGGPRIDCNSGMFFLMNTLDEGSNRVNLIQKLCSVNLSEESPEVELSEAQAMTQLKIAQQNLMNFTFPHCVINPTSGLWEKKRKVVELMVPKTTTFSLLSSDDRKISVIEFPLARYANFFMLDVRFPKKENFKFDNPHIEPQFDSVPFGSNLGQSILCIVSALPTSMKIHVLMTLRTAHLPCLKWQIVTPSDFSLTVMDLIYMTLSEDLIREIKYSQTEFKRFEHFREKVCSFPNQFTEPYTARCTIAIIRKVLNSAKKLLRKKPDKMSYVEYGCEQMSQTLRANLDVITLGSLAGEIQKRASLTTDLFFDYKLIFTPEQLHPYDGYISVDN